MSSSWVPSRHQYRMNQLGKKSRWEVCPIHKMRFESYGVTRLGHMGPKRCKACSAEDAWWDQAERELGYPANLDKHAVYRRATAIGGLPLERYLRYAR